MMRVTILEAGTTGPPRHGRRRPSTANANAKAKAGSGVASPPTRQGRSSSSISDVDSITTTANTSTNTRKPSTPTSTSSSTSSRRLHMPWSGGSRKDRDKALHAPPQALAQTQTNQPDSTSNPPKSSHKHAASTTNTPPTSESPSHRITTPAQPPSRPRLGARTLSAPLAHSSLDSPPGVHGHDFQAYLDYSRYLSGDDETPQDDISKDPFFQRYHESPHYTSSASNDIPSPMDGPQANGPRSPPSQAADLHDINIGVIGDHGVGKSQFMGRAFGIVGRPCERIETRKLSIDGAVHTVRLVEVAFKDLDLEDDDRISWPDKVQDAPMPRIDGALMLYDVMNQESLAQVPGMLNVVHKTALPCVLVGCKCDHHPAHRQVDPAVVEQRAKTLVGELPAFRSSDGSPESQRLCLSVMLRAILASRQANAALRRRAASNSSALRPISPRPGRNRKHERASSEFSGSRLKFQSDNDAEVQIKTAPRAYNAFADLEEPTGYDSFGSEANDSDYEPSIVSVMPSDENGYTLDQLVDRLVAQPQSKQDTKFIAIFLALYRKFAAPSQLLDAIIKRFDALEHEKHPKMIRTTSQLRHLSIMDQWLSNYPGDFAHPLTKRKMMQFVNRLSHNRIFAVAYKEILSDLEVAHEDDDTDWACNDKNRERADQGRSPSVNHVIVAEESEDDSLSKSTTDLSISVTGDSASQKDANSSHFERSGSATSTSSAGTMLNTIDAARRQAKLLVPIPRAQLTKTQWHLLMGEPEEAIARELTRIDWIMFSSIRPRDLVRHVSLNAAEKKKCKNLDNVDRMIEHFNHLAYWVTNFILFRDKPKHRAMMLEKFMKVARKLRELNNYNSLGAILAGLNGTAIHRLAATRELIQPAIAKDFMKLEILMSTQKSHFAYRLAWENSSGERIPYLPLHRRDLVSAAEGNATFVAEPSRRPSANPQVAMVKAANADGGAAKAEAESAAKLQAVLNRTGQQEKEAPPGGIEGRERINWKKFAIMGEVIVGIQRAQGVPYPNIARNDDIKSLVLDLRICKDDDELYDRSTCLEAIGAAGEQRRRFANWFR
ncbi:ras guanine nucleotide exchange factor domain-containing protein [Phyllosticta citricarpa]|uniref:Ras guanine nucleotide exchange factor domain-containing protein n=1 Tax=Phyllosticta citricarpa TaxID=55181 RepID=A0ABR1MM48_9PEZI